MTEVKGVARRRTQFFDDLRNRKIHWELKEEAEEETKTKTTVFQSNIRKKYEYKLSSIRQWT